ncbi:MAG: BPSL0067 family protein [Burkholderiales bacterium]|nr:BPSL0067 family protein [Burkholderiales bacterium]MDE1926697.1 BPSL0067 family protein [Burkholderiales bacterium]MDE2157550.1 BPSL0067 family protein [Burkholderiales bacterium]MDE2503002.1 BPSL0067 family protein [Burkholderiales bacterium]
MPHVLPAAESYRGRAYRDGNGNTECVEFIKQTLGAPVTSAWRQGVQVQKLAARERDPIAKGTAIATFVSGVYPQHGSTGKHAAIYLGQNADGIQVMDQWRSQGQVLPRTIPWVARRPGLSNDGTAFSVIEW